ncbi:MAG: hypothetical protein E6308_11210 [Escherichia coli]|nr:hypothetical protein [Escherichia coli]
MAKGQSLQDPFLNALTVSQMVYKHAISTVVPSRPVSHHSNNAGGGTSSNYHHGSSAQNTSAQQDSEETE